jgi:hypothetical protein
MEYTPAEIQRMGIGERLPGEAETLVGPSIIRRLRATEFKAQNGLLFITAEPLRFPLVIACRSLMTFGTESIMALEYFRRVIERDDIIDAVVSSPAHGSIPIQIFWIRIEYVGTPPAAGAFSKKDDGLFAMRAKAGEKAERVVTRLLRDTFGHRYPDGMCDSPGFFEIRYAGKKTRKPDRRCLTCGLTLEIKKRNKDEHFRVSHSAGRPFASENAPAGWHAFVFPDMTPRFLPNTAIAQAIAQGHHRPGSDRYDSWADVDSLVSSDPPYCFPHTSA